MPKSIQLSVIIPVYNTEKYLERCINSLLCQNSVNLEIIVVDDGSTDNSYAVAQGILHDKDNVVLIHIEHSGIALARYVGVKASKGEYITFIDSDDWIEENAYGKLVNLVDNYDLDILAWTYYRDENGTLYEVTHKYDEGLYVGEDIKSKIVPTMMYDAAIGNRRLDPSLCCKIIRKNLYNLVADEGMHDISLGEDAMISYTSVFLCGRLYILNKPYYHYWIHNDSCANGNLIQRVGELEKFNNTIRRIFSDIGAIAIMSDQVDNYIRVFLSEMVEKQFGFSIRPIKYHFPAELFECGMSIVVYGAGNVGESYVNYIVRSGLFKIEGWIDKNYKTKRSCCGVTPESIERLKGKKFDKLLIAIADRRIANDVEKELSTIVSKEKIVWKEPVWIN